MADTPPPRPAVSSTTSQYSDSIRTAALGRGPAREAPVRDPHVAARNLRSFFEPRSVAVVGASPDPARGGHRIVRNLLEHFRGRVYAVNPRATEVLGLPTYP